MGFVYVTGVAGSGKSAIASGLQARGVAAFDEDAPGVGAAHEKSTGRPVLVPPAGERGPEWFAAHEWRLLDSALERLRISAETGVVVLCGNSLDDAQLRALDATVLYLTIDDGTLRRRVAERTDNDYGKTESELTEILQRHRSLDRRFLSTATPIDAVRPLETVLADVIEHLEMSPS